MTKPNLKNIDRTFWGLYIALIVVAVIALFSASSTLVYMHHSALGPIGQQMFFIVMGVIAAFGIQYIPSYWVRFGGYVLLAVASFMAGDVITAVLSRKRNRTETEEKQEERRS